MGIKVITAPAAEPVSLDDMKAHLRVDHDIEDALIGSMIAAARELVETTTGRSLVTRTLELVLDRFPGGPIALPRAPLQAVSSLIYRDPAGTEQTMDPAAFLVDEIDGCVAALRYPWPSTAARFDAVRVRYVAGYGDAAAVPETFKQAMRLLVAHWYGQREAVVIGAGVREVPFGVQRLLNQVKLWRAV